MCVCMIADKILKVIKLKKQCIQTEIDKRKTNILMKTFILLGDFTYISRKKNWLKSTESISPNVLCMCRS